MNQLWMALVALTFTFSFAAAEDKNETKGKKVEFETYTSYFESNKSGLTGDASYLAFANPASFDMVFGKAVVMGQKAKFLAKDTFDRQIVVATIKRGKAVWTYKVTSVTADNDTLYVNYEATSKVSDSATFASPLVVVVDKGKYTKAVFVENGKEVGTAKIGS